MESTLPTRTEILTALTFYYEQGDLSFIETVNNISYGYKVEMKRNYTKPNQTNNDQRE